MGQKLCSALTSQTCAESQHTPTSRPRTEDTEVNETICHPCPHVPYALTGKKLGISHYSRCGEDSQTANSDGHEQNRTKLRSS